MKFYGNAEEVCNNILKQFQEGSITETMKKIFVTRSDSKPSSSWSFCNQFIMILNGTCDARGFKQWKTVGRRVIKGKRAFYILAPCFAKIKENEEEKQILYGFKSVPVFRLEDTEIFDEELWNTTGKDIKEDK